MTTLSIEREIAKIERTFLGYEDHGILTAYLHVTYGGAGQGIGGYDLRPGNGAVAARWIDWTLKACGVRSWEDLKGRTIYVLTSERRVVGIEPLPTEPGERFMFTEAGAA
jgi:hypothetical protein